MKTLLSIRHKQKDISGIKTFINEIISNRYMYLLALPGILFFFVFSYLPMFGIIIAFQEFNPFKGISGSKFVGWRNFEFFFTSLDWGKVTFNTVYLNALFIITGILSSMMIAVMLSEIGNIYFKKTAQSFIILPHFISWTVVAMFSVTLISSDSGLINSWLKGMGMESVSFYQDAGIWPSILILIKIWKGAGYNSIIFLAVIAGIDVGMYEAAKLDGARKLQCIFHITLPMLKTTAILVTLLGVGNIFHGDFGMIYPLVGDNSLLYPTTDVIDTFVYRSLRNLGDMGMASAVGLYQSVVGFVLVFTVNGIVKKIDSESAIF